MWTEITADDGEPFLMNLGVIAGFKRDKQTHNAIAVTLTGFPIPLGEAYATIKADSESGDTIEG